jgi:hypothetical protein
VRPQPLRPPNAASTAERTAIVRYRHHMSRAALVAISLVGMCGCTKPSDTTTHVTASGAGSSGSATGAASGAGSATPATVSPDARAREVLQRQIDAALANSEAEFEKTFAPDTVVFVPGKGPTTPDNDASQSLGGTGPDGGKIAKSTITKLVAQGSADAVWFYAEVTVAGGGPNDAPASTHVVELLAADKGWRVVAASFDAGRDIHPSGGNFETPDGTPPDGPLAKLVPPSALGAAAAPDAIIGGPTGIADLAALKRLEPLTIYKGAREVRAGGYGFVQATADHPRSDRKLVDRVNVQLFSVPSADQTWKVVLAQYSGQ